MIKRSGDRAGELRGDSAVFGNRSGSSAQIHPGVKSDLAIGPVRIRHSSHDFGWQSSHSVFFAGHGWQAKMASIVIGYHGVMHTSPIIISSFLVEIRDTKLIGHGGVLEGTWERPSPATPSILARVVNNIIINFSPRSPRKFRFFSFFESVFTVPF